MNKVYASVAAMLKDIGFIKSKSKKNAFYRELNDVIVCFLIDCPSNSIYLQFDIHPLYIPSDRVFCYRFGNRLNDMFSELSYLHKDDEEQNVKIWCECAKDHILNDLLPLAESISAAEGFRDYLRLHRKQSDYNIINCSSVELNRFLVYLHAYLHHRVKAALISSKFFCCLFKSRYPPKGKKEKCKEMISFIITDLFYGSRRVSLMFEKMKTDNRDFFR
ncbi:MAG: hypothetical protein Q4G00_02895 [Clostridia bacterium]|nr:hypothetical protein [Clostridia bacterium]